MRHLLTKVHYRTFNVAFILGVIQLCGSMAFNAVHHLQVGESVITDNCRRRHICQASGVVLSQNMTCKADELCQVKDGVMGCYLQQCFLGADGTLAPFDGEGGTIAEPGAYEIIQNCERTLTSHWFRVVVKLERCNPGVNTVAAVYVFFKDVMITVNDKHGVWVRASNSTRTHSKT